ncbi:uncharacterized protein N7498_001826 [Penicillium cinerascens]|uniref:Allergen Asp f 15 n=1 Tax=Penicillium cinerascens TaxID=70096 RepID=A0A9W9TAN2_9EURO|nr:uncharacterized protein N7498_001826 [Penicillium cinerascens]KAJ5215419.1 hypothetical protein N7498_001826 [Penicillium cinerascens]
MKTFTTITLSLLATLHFAGAAPFSEDGQDEMLSVLVSYDQKYDVGGTSLNTVACSDGDNGLESRFPTFSDLPAFPRIGGALTIAGWNSTSCGSCYALHYQSGDTDQTINVLAIDAASGRFNIGLQAFNQLTDNQGVKLGSVTATYTPIADSECGM